MVSSRVIRGGLWLYVGSLLYSFLAYLFWIMASVFVQPEIIGLAAATLALQSLLMTLFTIGIPMGLRRFIGISRGKSDIQLIKSYLYTSLIILTLAIIVPVIILIVFLFLGIPLFGLTGLQLIFVIILILFSYFPPLFTSLFDSLIRTEVSVLATLISSIAKILIGSILLFSRLAYFGIMCAFILATIIGDLILLISARKFFKQNRTEFEFKKSHGIDLLRSGLPYWVPQVLTFLAQTLGLLSIFNLVGSAEAGLYHLAFAISAIVYALSNSILNLMFPVLSGMDTGREKAISQATRIALAFAVPISMVLSLYPLLIFSFLGPAYYGAAVLLSILALGAVISPINAGFLSYVYSLGKYWQVTIIGLTTTISRLVLYYFLIVFWGAFGIAIAYVVGELVTLVVIFIMSPSVGYRPQWYTYFKTIIIPGGISLILFFLNVPWFIGVPILIILTLVIFARLSIVTKEDLHGLAGAFLSKETIAKIYVYARPLLRVMYGE